MPGLCPILPVAVTCQLSEDRRAIELMSAPPSRTRPSKPSATSARLPAAIRSARATACGCPRSEEHTSELQSLMRISYAVFCLKKKNKLLPDYIAKNDTEQINTT